MVCEENDTGHGVSLVPSSVSMEAKPDAPLNTSDAPDHNIEIEADEDSPFNVNPITQEDDHGVVGDVDEPLL